ncbi:MAG: GNAT family N-acetyltransferase, partial [Candidatus Stygibacter frigidus]|nr:GNAT family N-acetyltransferase [Candidatus Stygibacter frigidus]
IGWVSSYYIKKDRKQRAVGINITEQQFWGNGFGREALTLFIKYLFDNNISTLFCQTWSGNTRMTRLAQSLGFIKIEDTEIVIIKNEKYNHIKYQIGSSKKNKL